MLIIYKNLLNKKKSEINKKKEHNMINYHKKKK